MTAWMREIRAMTNEIGAKRGRPLLLSVRVLARPEQNLIVGLDPATWAQEGLVDFITVAHFLRNDFPLPVKKYREIMPAEMPIYASIEVENTDEKFRHIARQLYNEGADGLMMFNYFSSRGEAKSQTSRFSKNSAIRLNLRQPHLDVMNLQYRFGNSLRHLF